MSTDQREGYAHRFVGRDGTFDLIEIINPDSQVIATLYDWDDAHEEKLHNNETKRLIRAAKTICKHLNHWQIGEPEVIECSGGGVQIWSFDRPPR